MPRVLSGIQPTADSLHLGNYLGALRQWVALQDDHDAFYCVVDLHAITVEHDPAELRARTRVDGGPVPRRRARPRARHAVRAVPRAEHAQLAWVLGCITGFGEASRMTQFKDKAARGGGDRASVGLFTYPILQAADILLYQARPGAGRRGPAPAPRAHPRPGAAVQHPVRRHVHGARAAHRQGDREDLRPADRRQADEQEHRRQRLSSGCSTTPKVIEKKIKSAVTDTGREVRFDPAAKPGVSNLLAILSSFTGDAGRRPRAALRGQRLRRPEEGASPRPCSTSSCRSRSGCSGYLDDPAALDDVLARGAEPAREVASPTLATVYDRLGFLPRRQGPGRP